MTADFLELKTLKATEVKIITTITFYSRNEWKQWFHKILCCDNGKQMATTL